MGPRDLATTRMFKKGWAMDFYRLIGVYVFFILMIDTYMQGGNF